ncbi:ABC transporter permease subunit [Litoribacter alkaliphilus]|uniref:ABC transporter permease subunit n=1 Tax=Litoribacter ruber TaxID=702568 RepID=A0AAP2G1N8_9BACT|nr:ABC transporter permease subunit [Litoribacter alkaliphilus]MBS9524482.1 ABC transporter permease subunit [Litoribacter alkaliphilus]
MTRIIKYILFDMLRTRFILLYLGFLLLSTLSMFMLDGDNAKVVLSLLNIVLLVVPLVSVIFTTIHFYNSYEFMEMMLSQPINRKTVFLSQYLAVILALSLALLVGVGLPIFLYGASGSALTLLYAGLMLTFVFVSLAFLAAVFTRDKAKAIGVGLLFWFYFALIYDALLLWVVYQFADYPIERATLAMISFNPVDLARILMLLQLDISALMGYTGAFYKEFFGSNMGFVYSTAILLLWTLIPVTWSMRIFKRKDL